MESASFVAALALPSPAPQISGTSKDGDAVLPGLDALFEYVPNLYFFIKDGEGRFVRCKRCYLTNVRINAACHLLISTDLAISEIALKTGFCDQSHLSNQFTRHRGMSPSKYRNKYPSDAERAMAPKPATQPPGMGSSLG